MCCWVLNEIVLLKKVGTPCIAGGCVKVAKLRISRNRVRRRQVII